MALKPQSLVRQLEQPQQFSYRCPGCGEMVDGRELATVLEHHRHVLQPAYAPPWFLRTAADAQSPSSSHAGKTAHAPQVRQRDAFNPAADPSAGRYGH